MTSLRFLLSPDLARAGRALSQVSAKTIAAAADVPRDKLRKFERGTGPLTPQENLRVREALEEYGVLFLPDDENHGYGVRQKFNAGKVRRLERWENEGGPTGFDDI